MYILYIKLIVLNITFFLIAVLLELSLGCYTNTKNHNPHLLLSILLLTHAYALSYILGYIRCTSLTIYYMIIIQKCT